MKIQFPNRGAVVNQRHRACTIEGEVDVIVGIYSVDALWVKINDIN